MNGYKAMLRDRMPLTLDLALRWCKAKQRWIDYVYDKFVKKYPKERRGVIVKTLLGIRQQYKRQDIYDHMRYVKLDLSVSMNQVNNIPKNALFMSFEDTIDWEELSKEEGMVTYWAMVESWVQWFKESHAYIENSYQISLKSGCDEKTAKANLMAEYGLESKLTDYLIKSFK